MPALFSVRKKEGLKEKNSPRMGGVVYVVFKLI